MDITFDKKSVLVTGAVRGIGKQICHQFAANGATVWAADIETTLLDGITDVTMNCFDREA